MTKQFSPTPGFFNVEQVFGGWRILGQGDQVAFVPLHKSRPLWQTENDAMLLAGAPEMFETMVTAHNKLNDLNGATHFATDHLVRRIQGSLRGCLVKVVGGSDQLLEMTNPRIIMPLEQ